MALFETDSYDKHILYELDKNSRISLSSLAKKIRRSKPFVLYRMSKLEKAGIITGYHAIVDMSKLGYFSFRIYLKLQQMTKEKEKIFVEYLKKNHPEVWTITSMHGKWDYALFLGVKNINEFHALWDRLLNSYKESIKNYNMAIYAPIHNFNRTFFLEKKEDAIERVYGAGEKEEVDEKDLRILETYASDVRMSSIEIGKKLKISSDTVRKKIKDMEKKRVIVGYKIGLGLSEFGYESYRIDLQLLSTKRNADLFAFCQMHKNIYQINKTIGGADYEIEVIVENAARLNEVIEEIKEHFKEIINDVEYFGFSTFHVLKYIPD